MDQGINQVVEQSVEGGNFYLGCAVWAYKGWVGDFYPVGTTSSQFLARYSQQLSMVECNSTFYAVPKPETLRHWREQVDPEFRFCPKFPRDLTHQGLLVPQVAAAQKFIEQMQELGDNLGCLFIQLPPQYDRTQLEDLQQFLAILSPETTSKYPKVSLALEVRHPSWFQPVATEKLNQVLATNHLSRVILDTRPIYAQPRTIGLECRKPDLPVQFATTDDHVLVRYISHPDPRRNQPYLQEWVEYIDQWLAKGKTIYFAVHCPQEEYSPQNALILRQLLENAGIAVIPERSSPRILCDR
ncbi:MAG: DUF72 domain-containing protein [Coleofasciculaceae cyanobacterium SM2_1_6]|nr:DUF72 domain-containing protein [Coleofasciculaceae cyanobacterium SM2_1_6]